MAPDHVRRLVVAHEVAHLVHLNHGPRFWSLAEQLCDGPMAEPRAWLKANGETLDKLKANGLPDSMLEHAKERTQQIREAYEFLRERRGLA